jgi:hypothetical protein
MYDRIHLFGGKGLRKPLFRGRVRHFDLVHAGFVACGGGWLRVEREDTRKLSLFLQEADEVRSEERGGAGHGDHTPARRRCCEWR